MNGNQKKSRLSGYGTVVFLDLDNFKTCMEEKNWSEYTPNPITRYLTQEIMRYVREYRVLTLWGLDRNRGTEEAILFFQYEKEFVQDIIEELREDVMTLAHRHNAPTSLSAGLAEGKTPKVKKIKSHSKREFKKDLTIFLAYRALKKAKKKGGNRIIVY
jgi:GGDEF domain-containing protein